MTGDPTKSLFSLRGNRRNSYQEPPSSSSIVAHGNPSTSYPNDEYEELGHGATGYELSTYEGLRQRSGEESGNSYWSNTNEREQPRQMSRNVDDDLYVNTAVGEL